MSQQTEQQAKTISGCCKIRIYFSVSIAMSEQDRTVQFILKSENVEFKYLQDKAVTPPPRIDFQDKVNANNII